jgi:hypothetical protein
MSTPKDIAMITSMLSAAYPNWNVTEYTNEVYFQDLKDIPSEELILAAQHCRSEQGRKFAPSVGEIRGAVMELRKASMNTPSAYEAWQEVCKQLLDNGGDFGNPVWSTPIVEKAVKALGWRNLRMSEDPVSDRMRFIQAYEQLQARAERDTMLIPEVRGFIESKGGRLLESPMDQIKQLSKGMSK